MPTLIRSFVNFQEKLEMSIQSKLYVDEKTFVILRSSFSYHQNCDASNRPQGKVFGGLFDILLESTRDDLFTEWAIHPTMMKNVKIVQSPITMGGKSRTFELIDTVCTYDENSFSATDKEPMKNFITLSPAILKLDGLLLHEKFWKVTNLSAQNVAPTTISKEKELTRYYLTDVEGNPINDYETGDRIVLNIETEHRIGDTISINLNDFEHDFKHNGNVLANDILQGIGIGNNLEQIELEVIAPQKA